MRNTTESMVQDPQEEASKRKPNYHNYHSYHNHGYHGYHGYGGHGGAGYGGYGYGYGDDYSTQHRHPHRTFRDYIFILRERIWFFLVIFLIVFLGSVLYTFNTTPLFTAGATVQVLRDPVNPLGAGAEDITKEEIRTSEDLNTQIKILESLAIVNSVADRIKGAERKMLMEPYKGDEEVTINEVLYENRDVVPLRASLLIAVTYTHPDARIAAHVANLFADEYINYNLRLTIENSMKAVEDLKLRVNQQRSEVEALETKLAEYKERTGSISVEEREDIDLQEIMQLNQVLTTTKQVRDQSKHRWEQIQSFKAEGKPLQDLPFIAEMPLVQDLQSQLSELKVSQSSAAKRYREGHPRMISINQSIDETQSELTAAVNSAVQKVHAAYVISDTNYNHAKAEISRKEKDLIGLAKTKVEFNAIKTDLEANRDLHRAMVLRLNTEIAQVNLKNPTARIVDKATPPIYPSHPKILLNLFLGFSGGIMLSLIFVGLLAFFDDRVKTAYDVEGILNLPLIGVVAKLQELSAKEKAIAVASNADRRVTEAFRSVHSALNLNEISKNAQIILMTSTVPSEGKSFVSTNLAYTYASHGERVVLIDCDLRMPNVAKSMNLSNEKGLQQCLKDGSRPEDVVHKDVYPNLDVMGSGGHSQKSTQILNDKRFIALLEDLRGSYDRVFIDSPPVAAVSDALNVLPHVDGVLYVINYNTVKRKTVKASVRRLFESNVPVFGVIMNQITAAMSSYYYTNYYEKSYDKYYTGGSNPKA